MQRVELLKESQAQRRSVQRKALSSVGVAVVVSIALALLVWAAIGVIDPGQAGFGSQGLGSGRGLVLIAVGVFAATMAVWSRLHRKNDADF
jgi:hypothetical protein